MVFSECIINDKCYYGDFYAVSESLFYVPPWLVMTIIKDYANHINILAYL